jgi:hypothetical protein
LAPNSALSLLPVGSIIFVRILCAQGFFTAGDSQNQIHFEGYQVSNQCMALVNDDCLIPTRDAPELGYIKESSNEQYVPDVFYKVTLRENLENISFIN